MSTEKIVQSPEKETNEVQTLTNWIVEAEVNSQINSKMFANFVGQVYQKSPNLSKHLTPEQLTLLVKIVGENDSTEPLSSKVQKISNSPNLKKEFHYIKLLLKAYRNNLEGLEKLQEQKEKDRIKADVNNYADQVKQKAESAKFESIQRMGSYEVGSANYSRMREGREAINPSDIKSFMNDRKPFQRKRKSSSDNLPLSR